MKKTLAFLLLPAALVAALAFAENRTDVTFETTATVQQAIVQFVDGGCMFQSTGTALQDGGAGARILFGASPSFFVPIANATCSQLSTVGLKCLKFGMGLDGGGCP